ncbi:MAG: SseB family protein [Cellvibrionaceae bacterium]|nr:SseB family protein [Cellvibrionaceae bacterium]
MTERLIPENELERLLVDAQSGKIDFQEFIRFFLKADIFVPSAAEVMQDGSGLEPLLFDKKGTQMLGVFTSMSRVSLFQNMASFCMSMKGYDLISLMPEDIGLVVNPGFDKGLEISPSGLKAIFKDHSLS